VNNEVALAPVEIDLLWCEFHACGSSSLRNGNRLRTVMQRRQP
jgi:hypothetical protein